MHNRLSPAHVCLLAPLVLASACHTEHSPAGDLGTFGASSKRKSEQTAKHVDAGSREDSGRPLEDSGREDAGQPTDASSREDSGHPADASTREDSSEPADAGTAPKPTNTTTDAGCGTSCMTADAGSKQGAATKVQSAWTMLGYDLSSTYNNSAETLLTKQNAPSLRERFSFAVGKAIHGAPLLVDETLYFNGGHDIWAVDVANGKLRWNRTLSSQQNAEAAMSNSMAYEDGTLYVHTSSAGIAAIDAHDGSLRWEVLNREGDRFGRGYSSPIVARDLVLVGRALDGEYPVVEPEAFRGNLAAFDKHSGKEVWRLYLADEADNGAGIRSTVAVDLDLGHVFATSINNVSRRATDTGNAIVALALTTGELRFTAQAQEGLATNSGFGANAILFEAQFNGQPTKLVAAGSRTGSIYTLKRETGELAWEVQSAPSGTSNAGILINGAWSGKSLLFAVNDGGKDRPAAILYALDPSDGKGIWRRELSSPVLGRITVANGVGFVATGTQIEVFDIDDGSLLHKLETGGVTAAGTASIANGLVAFGTGATTSERDDAQDGKVMLFEVPNP